jgi:hypothetical protein
LRENAARKGDMCARVVRGESFVNDPANSSDRWLLGALLISYCCILLGNLDTPPYDDAYFFKRFASNALRYGELSWNLTDGPVYGLTSQLLEIVAVVLTLIAPEHFVVANKVFLTGCLLAAAWFLYGLAVRASGRRDLATGVTLLAMGCPLTAWTAHTGMETALSLLAVVLSLGVILEPTSSRRSAPIAAVATVFVYLSRPDAAIIPAATFVVVNLRERRTLVVYGATLALLMGGLLAVFRAYYGTALPLPFYAKTLGVAPHDALMQALSSRDKLLHLCTFGAFFGPLVFLCRLYGDQRALALVVAGVALVLYHALATTEIMGYRGRFYVPASVPLALAAARGAPRALATKSRRRFLWFGLWAAGVMVLYASGLISSSKSSALEEVRWPAYTAQLLLAGWLVFSRELVAAERPSSAIALVLFVAGVFTSFLPRNIALLRDREFLKRSSAMVTTTRGIFDIERCLPPTLTVFHSEIGVPGLVLPNARVVDLVGLMSREIAIERPLFETLCSRERPEAIFLPHRNYMKLNAEASACLANYTRMVRHSSSPLYVRKDLAPGFSRCSRDVARWQ